MHPERTDILKGTLDLLILRTLASGSEHGCGITRRLQALSDDVLQVTRGALYLALARLENKGWLASEFRASATNRRARFYRLTPAGRRHLATATSAWRCQSDAIRRILLSS